MHDLRPARPLGYRATDRHALAAVQSFFMLRVALVRAIVPFLLFPLVFLLVLSVFWLVVAR